MALARTYAMALAGVQGHVVEIEADIENGLVARDHGVWRVLAPALIGAILRQPGR